MENLAHTLLGLSLAKAGLERATPLAATTLVISSNLPDIDVLTHLGGDTLDYIEHHRGFTHSFLGLAALAVGFTILLIYLDRKFRLRRDPFRRPIRPWRILALAYVGGLGHLFMDFTNVYGVRPLLPFSNRWFYGDLTFIVDPWIWLILGSSAVWLTLKDAPRFAFWLIVGVGTSLMMALALRQPTPAFPLTVPTLVRVIWFVGLAIVVAGAVLGWGRAGQRFARYSLILLGIYYVGLWMAHQTALEQTRRILRNETITSQVAWPTPATPLLWQAVASTGDLLHSGYVHLTGPPGDWQRLPIPDPKLAEAIRQSEEGRKFLSFARYVAADVGQNESGYVVTLRDLRFDLRLFAQLDPNLLVQSAEVRWFR